MLESEIYDAISSGDPARLEELRERLVADSRALLAAIYCGSLETISWLLAAGASPVGSRDDGEGFLRNAIYRKNEDRYEVMERLIDAGADIHEIGMAGYTPAHLAAARNDVAALKVLHARNADFGIRTYVDDEATPLEEAKSLYPGSVEAIEYLESLGTTGTGI